jgi:hypothetical protein
MNYENYNLAKNEDKKSEIIFRLLHIVEQLVDLLAETKIAKYAKGKIMPARIVVGGLGATFKFTEFDGATPPNIVPPKGPIAFSSDNPAVASVDSTQQVLNADGSVSVPVVAVGANADGSDATANITGVDPASTNEVAAGDVITVGEAAAGGGGTGVAVSATGVLTANTAAASAAFRRKV